MVRRGGRTLWVLAITASLTTLPVAPARAVSTTVRSVALGAAHTCAITVDGALSCWGYNAFGQLGDGTLADRTVPTPVTGLADEVQAVSAGGAHTCALTAGGGVKCWGRNAFGALGDGTTTDRHTPVDVVGLTSGVTAIAAGGEHTCALTAGGGVKCWGSGFFGNLGDGTTIDRHTPVDVVGLATGVSAITTNGWSSCALTTGGGVKCWGDTPISSSTPVDVEGLTSGVDAVTTGGTHICALMTVGEVRCLGENRYGELGDGTTGPGTYPATVADIGAGAVAISAAGTRSCAVTTGGRALCWGSGLLGDGTTINRALPVDVVDVWVPVEKVVTGGGHTCALTTGGGLRCWGQNGYGALGDGTNVDRLAPVPVTGLGGPTALPPCSASLVRTGTSYRTAQAAVRAAADGDVIRVRGVCVGSTTIDRKDLALVGISTRAAPTPVLSGDQAGRVLTVSDARVTVRDLTLTDGTATTGGGIRQMGGRVTLAGDTAVLRSVADRGGGVHVSGGGELALTDDASIRLSWGGGVLAQRSVVTLTGTSGVTDNASGDGTRGGGIDNVGGTIRLMEAATVSDNALGSDAEGGGIYNGGGSVTLGGSSAMIANTVSPHSEGGAVFNDGGVVKIRGSAKVIGVRPYPSAPTSLARGSGIQNQGGRLVVGGRARIGETPAILAGYPSWPGYRTGIENVGGVVSLVDGARVIGNGVGVVNREGTVSLLGSASVRTSHGSGLVNLHGAVTMDGHTSIRDNEAALGAGLRNEGGFVTMLGRSTIAANTWSLSGGGIWNGKQGTVTLHDEASVVDNWTRRAGGGIRNVGGGVVSLFDSAMVSRNRSAHYGGGISNGPHASVVLYDSSSVVLNSASLVNGGIHGGTVYLCSSEALLGPNDPDDPPPTEPCP